MDILVHGCYKMINFSNKNVIEYDLSFILKKLNIDYNTFVNMSIYFGCDYVKYNLNLSKSKIYEEICTKKINNYIIDNYNEEFYNDYMIKFNNAKHIFLQKYDLNLINKIEIINNININELLSFLQNNFIFLNYNEKNNLINKIKIINDLIDQKIFTNIN